MQIKQLITTILITILLFGISSSTVFTAESEEQPDPTKIIGEWVRPDGGYVIDVRNIIFDGSVDAAYFNPSEINVAEANVSTWKGLVKLFIKLQDEGYPGSTYTLYYYEDKDALAGFYYQAVLDQTFEVVFFRK